MFRKKSIQIIPKYIVKSGENAVPTLALIKMR